MWVINTATNAVIKTVEVGDLPSGVAVSPNSSRVYVTNAAPIGTVSVINSTTNTVTETIPVGNSPIGVAVSPNGARVYITNRGYPGPGSLQVINAATNDVTETLEVGEDAWALAVSSDEERIYVTNLGDDSVSVIGDHVRHFPDVPDLVGDILGGVAGDGGGWLIIGNHFYKIPPRPLAVVRIARAIAPYLGKPIENRDLAKQLRNTLNRRR